MAATMAVYRIKKVKGHRYLVKEVYDPSTHRKRTEWTINIERIERIYALLKDLKEDEIARLLEIVRNGRVWCGGWDLNPRRPTPSGPEPDPFDLARAPPHRL